ncbi:pectate lyase [Marinilabilia sp.]|uniref:pectate lyase family protein n=1 Tax=Marinilabilia sp. TaxID=2021252 RepID=UPI0025BD26DB|nr:pectate lyase [Marinilabilia sp.]
MKNNFLNRTIVSIGVIGLIWSCELENITPVTDPMTKESIEQETQKQEEEQEETPQDTTSTSDDSYMVPAFSETKAFPSAEGYGRFTRGGREGRAIYVTSLDDSSAPGTLRYALEVATGPRTVLFKVSGIIELDTWVKIKDPYITIAGQSAPGSGITLKNSGIQIETHDVIIRHIRIRPGDDQNGTPPTDRDALFIYKDRNCHNIMLDHVSFTWGIDENVSFSTGTNNLTMQNCIVAEALSNSLHEEGEHSKGLLMLNDLDNISIVNNLFAHNYGRNPLISSNTRNVHVVNNLIYNWGPMRPGYGTHTQIFKDQIPINDAVIYGNMYRKGRVSSDVPLYRTGNWYLVDGSTFFIDQNYLDDGGNINPLKKVSTSFLDNPDFFAGFMMTKAPAGWESEYSNIKSISEVEGYVLNNVGTRVPIVDDVDGRIINETRTHSGDFVDSPRDRGGYPSQFQGTVPADSDGDGIPDKWEISKDLNPDSSNDAVAYTLSPYYTNLEMYLNELAGDYAL